MPDDLRDAITVNIFKKGDMSDCAVSHRESQCEGLLQSFLPFGQRGNPTCIAESIHQ